MEGGDSSIIEEGAPFDAEVVHYEAGHADLVADPYVGGGEGCREEDEEGFMECLHFGSYGCVSSSLGQLLFLSILLLHCCLSCWSCWNGSNRMKSTEHEIKDMYFLR